MFTIEEVSKEVKSGKSLLNINGKELHASKVEENGTWSVQTYEEGFPIYNFDMKEEVVEDEKSFNVYYVTNLKNGEKVTLNFWSLVVHLVCKQDS